MGIPQNMTMTLHEALEILDPFNNTPHDLYSILAYASVAHPDVGQMLDRFARAQHDATVTELERIREYTEATRLAQINANAETTTTTQAGGRFVPIDPTAAGEKEPVVVVGDKVLEKPQGLIELEERTCAAREAALKRKRAMNAAMAERRRLRGSTSTATALSSFVKPGQDKNFEYLVRKAEEELGWTGKYDEENNPKPKYSRAALRKEVSFWMNKATDVRDNLKWMQKQLIKELAVKDATFGTKRNAIVASMEILRAIVTDKGEIGSNLRQFWFDSLAANFKKMFLPLGEDERKELRSSTPKGKIIKDMKKLVEQVKGQTLNSAEVESALLLVDPKGDGAGGESESAESSSECEGVESGEADNPSEEAAEEDDEDEDEEADEDGEEDGEAQNEEDAEGEDEEEGSSEDDGIEDESE